MKKKRAFLKWAGGKYSLIDEIRQHLPDGDLLIEPFVGAGSVFMNTDYPSYILADINDDLISLYEVVKRRSQRFIEDAKLFFTPQYNQADAYYQLRAEFNSSCDPYYRSLLFLYLNRHCYNGLCRYNSKGGFNVPFGRYLKPYFPQKEILEFSEKAQNATFVCESYNATLSKAAKGAIVYCDPPYAPLSATANFTAYHTSNFSLQDQQSLADWAENLSSKQVTVLISNHDTELTRGWYHQAVLHKLTAHRRISRNGLTRDKVDELLALYCAKLGS